MGEDVSAFMRLSFTVVLLAFLMSAVINVLSISLFTLNEYAESITDTMDGTQAASITVLNQTRAVCAPLAYRVLHQHIDAVKSLSITYSSGETTSDYKTLLAHASIDVQVSVKAAGNGVYDITIVEVE